MRTFQILFSQKVLLNIQFFNCSHVWGLGKKIKAKIISRFYGCRFIYVFQCM